MPTHSDGWQLVLSGDQGRVNRPYRAPAINRLKSGSFCTAGSL